MTNASATRLTSPPAVTPYPAVAYNISGGQKLHAAPGLGESVELPWYLDAQWRAMPPLQPALMTGIGVLMTLVGLAGCLGNGLILFVLLRHKKLQRAANMYVFNLAIADFMMCLGNFPILIFSAFSKRWIAGYIGCKIYGFLGGLAGFVSINTLTAMACDRYNVIHRHKGLLKPGSKGCSVGLLVSVWIYSFFWAMPPFFGWGQFALDGGQISCCFNYMLRSASNISYIIAIFIFCFGIQVFVVVYCHANIVQAVCHHERLLRRENMDVLHQNHIHRHSQTREGRDAVANCPTHSDRNNTAQTLANIATAATTTVAPNTATAAAVARAASVVATPDNPAGTTTTAFAHAPDGAKTENTTAEGPGAEARATGAGDPLGYNALTERNSTAAAGAAATATTAGGEEVDGDVINRTECDVSNRIANDVIDQTGSDVIATEGSRGKLLRRAGEGGEGGGGGVTRRRRVEVKVTRLVCLITLSFFVSWTPFAVVALIGVFGDASSVTPLVSVLPGIVAKIATVINPILYAFAHPQYRNVLCKKRFSRHRKEYRNRHSRHHHPHQNQRRGGHRGDGGDHCRNEQARATTPTLGPTTRGLLSSMYFATVLRLSNRSSAAGPSSHGDPSHKTHEVIGNASVV